jgi:hypothetical protein
MILMLRAIRSLKMLSISLSLSFFFMVLGLELRAYTLSQSTSPFCIKYFWDRVSQTICLGWLRTTILLIAASWVARITGVSHQHPAAFCLLKQKLKEQQLLFLDAHPAGGYWDPWRAGTLGMRESGSHGSQGVSWQRPAISHHSPVNTTVGAAWSRETWLVVGWSEYVSPWASDVLLGLQGIGP